ncbi:MAG: zinc-ribbon domain-containing protein [Rhodocyclaceae bacterium]|nr:zinc-ribbon domain-containing protein [Rhodocyclaceae bacterium]
MLTRCPHCQTRFRITPEQLKARAGLVRCGVCREAFNALDSLSDEPLFMAPALPTTSAVPPEARPIAEAKAAEAEDYAPAVPADDAAFEPEAPAEPATEPIPPPSPALPAEPKPQLAPRPEAEPEPETEPEPAREAAQETALAPLEPATPPRRWPWAVASACLASLAALQLVFIYRVELAVLLPAMRPGLVAACEFFGCEVPYPRRPELVSIESSDLVPAEGERLRLAAVVKNRAPFPQEYPHLELTLTDSLDAALVRRVLAPAEWLPAAHAAAGGFPPGSEAAVDLLLEASGVPAVGYRLYLFYP